jgi:D-alanyl-D-alanine carboxypeptidase
MKKFATKIAASTLVVATAMAGCHSDSMMSTASASTAERSDQQAARAAEQARSAMERGDRDRAVGLAERAVELAPRDAGYRLLLADLYLRSGRFQSAESTYRDVLSIDPSNQRAGLSAALVQIGQGRTQAALEQLEAIQSSAPASDVGLAYALAGQPQRAIELLEPAARSPEANGRVRQNLALAYAFAGDWQRARTVAAQDVSPAELGPRLQQWASLAQPSPTSNAVAALLGVTPVADSGQPVRLALSAPAAGAPAFAAAVPAEPPIMAFAAAEGPAEQPIMAIAAAEPVPAPEPVDAPVAETIRYAEAPVVAAPVADTPGNWWPSSSEADPVPEAETPAPVRHAYAVRSLSTATPAIRASASPARAVRPTFQAAPVRRASAIQFPRAGAGEGRFVVQIGAFLNPANAERAWQQATSSLGLGSAQARTATVNFGGRTFHRVAIGGFASRSEAVTVCSAIQARGGSCFVRATAGDAPVRWASRSTAARRG